MNKSLFSIVFGSFLLSSLYAGTNTFKTKEGENMLLNYGDRFTLVKNEKVDFRGELSFMLKYFSHKTSVDGKTTKATARILVAKEGENFEILLSTYDSSEAMKEEDKFDRLYSHGLEFYLKAFDYDKSIDIIVDKNKLPYADKLSDETYF